MHNGSHADIAIYHVHPGHARGDHRRPDPGALTNADLTRLETTANDISHQVDALSKSDPTLAADVKRRSTDVVEDITYLKVKMRREGSVTRAEYMATCAIGSRRCG